jgi:chromosome partitioning protein
MDFQCNATTGLGLDRDRVLYSTFDLISNSNIKTHQVIQTTYLDNLKMIPASFSLKNVSRLLENDPEKNMTLLTRLKEIYSEYDFIFIDNPPSVSSMTFNSLLACDKIYIPVEMSYFSLEGIDQVESLVSLITELTESYHKFEKSVGTGKVYYTPKLVRIGGIILNKWNAVNKIDRDILSVLEENYSELILKTRIMEDAVIKEAIGEGIGIIDYNDHSQGSDDFRQLALEVIERES